MINKLVYALIYMYRHLWFTALEGKAYDSIIISRSDLLETCTGGSTYLSINYTNGRVLCLDIMTSC